MDNFKLEKFEGPLDLLLQLIEQDKLNISEISLAEIADQYIEYIEFHKKDIDANNLSNFLLIAAKLLLIKSKYLMPFLVLEDEEDEIADLEQRLRIYKDFLEASKKINSYFENKNISFFREKISLEREKNFFNPPSKLGVNDLKAIYKDLLSRLKMPQILDNEEIEEAVSVKERLEEIKFVILNRMKMGFGSLVNANTNKIEIIVSFLAVLELVKQKTITVAQEDHFEEIEIELAEGF